MEEEIVPEVVADEETNDTVETEAVEAEVA